MSYSFNYRGKDTFDSIEYLPLYRIRGDTIKCDSKDCLKIDARVGHYYVFYILKAEDKVGIVFEFRNASVMKKGLALTKIPTLKIGSQSMTVTLLVKLMTCDDINVIQKDHAELSITNVKSIQRSLINWWRRRWGDYTQKSELKECKLSANLANDAKEGKGVFCVDCMKAKYPQHYDNAATGFDGFAEFSSKKRRENSS